MALLEVLKFPDPRLRKKSMAVDKLTDEHRAFAKNMLETMYSFNGIGLAAPQVNRLDRLLVIDIRPRRLEQKDEEEPPSLTPLETAMDWPLVLFNPVVIHAEGKTSYEEGCLSVPTYYETVERFELIEVTGLNIDGDAVQFKADGLLSICIQHEIDHLDGKLFIDRLSTIKSSRIKSKIKNYGYPDPSDSGSDRESEDQ